MCASFYPYIGIFGLARKFLLSFFLLCSIQLPLLVQRVSFLLHVQNMTEVKLPA